MIVLSFWRSRPRLSARFRSFGTRWPRRGFSYPRFRQFALQTSANIASVVVCFLSFARRAGFNSSNARTVSTSVRARERNSLAQHHLPQKHRDRVRGAYPEFCQHPPRRRLQLRFDARHDVTSLAHIHMPYMASHQCITNVIPRAVGRSRFIARGLRDRTSL